MKKEDSKYWYASKPYEDSPVVVRAPSYQQPYWEAEEQTKEALKQQRIKNG